MISAVVVPLLLAVLPVYAESILFLQTGDMVDTEQMGMMNTDGSDRLTLDREHARRFERYYERDRSPDGARRAVVERRDGVLGIFLGLGGALAVARFSELPVNITPVSVLVAFLFAGLVGVFFGLHPARKASQLRPIEALRYE